MSDYTVTATVDGKPLIVTFASSIAANELKDSGQHETLIY